MIITNSTKITNIININLRYFGPYLIIIVQLKDYNFNYNIRYRTSRYFLITQYLYLMKILH